MENRFHKYFMLDMISRDHRDEHRKFFLLFASSTVSCGINYSQQNLKGVKDEAMKLKPQNFSSLKLFCLLATKDKKKKWTASMLMKIGRMAFAMISKCVDIVIYDNSN
ncbi:CLUMA_CG019331, isoform A [Clunio marinus]|uniref:CLUMA_CG019331, isoform A n=1 Tax=Clunio marinus TaxID=568069 RepID=A0A1J1J5G7_9DIPT|nr:CLUMA_CG019331, isoform A [Clunio marinus]